MALDAFYKNSAPRWPYQTVPPSLTISGGAASTLTIDFGQFSLGGAKFRRHCDTKRSPESLPISIGILLEARRLSGIYQKPVWCPTTA
jgi:hypothetical protein